jgi:hypothetical protein
MVLAPELATRLVMQDMDVDAEDARNIMGQSVQLGDLMNGVAEMDNAMNSQEKKARATEY